VEKSLSSQVSGPIRQIVRWQISNPEKSLHIPGQFVRLRFTGHFFNFQFQRGFRTNVSVLIHLGRYLFGVKKMQISKFVCRETASDFQSRQTRWTSMNFFVAICLTCIVCVGYCDSASADENAQSALSDQNNTQPNQNNAQADQNSTQLANQLVRESLYHEIYGRAVDGQACLAKAAEVDGNNPSVQWRQGNIYRNGKWQSLQQLADQATNDQLLKDYRDVRKTTRDTEAGHFQIAAWCAQKAMQDQAQVHLQRVLEFNPDNERAREALGHRRVNGRWFTPEEIDQQRIRFALDQKRIQSWQQELSNIGALATNGSRVSFQQAIRKLSEIKDASAVVPMEMILARQSLALDSQLVDHIASIDSLEAVDSLCRFAVFHPNQSIREAAADHLKARERFDYVPEMLASMVTPWISRFEVAANNRGQIVYRHSLFQQEQESHRVLQQDEVFSAVQQTQDATAEIAVDANQQFRRRAARTNMAQISENVQIEQLNQRICEALRAATGEEIGNDPRHWWSWWNDQNEVYYVSTKPVDVDRRQNSSLLMNDPQSGALVSQVNSQRCECLVAGTLIETELGPIPVESILTGDRVLTKDTVTGELMYKPVIRPTVRPTAAIFEIDLGNETVRSTGGHPFWVSGQGWVKARDLQSGMPIHTVDGVITVKSVKQNGTAVTHNLIVADNSNYFVGNSRILSHDNSLREATQVVVPGLIEQD
jgi:hypothetical protein